MASIRFTTGQQDLGTDSAAPSSPFRLRVSDVMSTALVTAAPDEQIAVVRSRAEARRVHHVVVLHASGGLTGILCLCDLERTGPGASAREAMSICPLFTSSGNAARQSEEESTLGVGD